MPIPSEFKYANEDEFTQLFVIPLLHRMGFSMVANYHGKAEHGKDLVFSEIDKFGLVRYHAIQVKYVASISLNASEELIYDCKQAYRTPFRHPQTGSEHRISSFYVVNGGSISDEAITNFFNELVPQYGGNVRLLQAKDLLVLDRSLKYREFQNSVEVKPSYYVGGIGSGFSIEVYNSGSDVFPPYRLEFYVKELMRIEYWQAERGGALLPEQARRHIWVFETDDPGHRFFKDALSSLEDFEECKIRLILEDSKRVLYEDNAAAKWLIAKVLER